MHKDTINLQPTRVEYLFEMLAKVIHEEAQVLGTATKLTVKCDLEVDAKQILFDKV